MKIAILRYTIYPTHDVVKNIKKTFLIEDDKIMEDIKNEIETEYKKENRPLSEQLDRRYTEIKNIEITLHDKKYLMLGEEYE